MALLLAATHPERVSRWCSTAATRSATWSPDYPWAQTQEARRAYTDQLVSRWDWEADCPAAHAVGRRGDAAVVGPADARRGHAVDDPGADGHELPGRRSRRARLRSACRPWCCTASATRCSTSRTRATSPTASRGRGCSCSRATTTSAPGTRTRSSTPSSRSSPRPGRPGRAAARAGRGRRGRRARSATALVGHLVARRRPAAARPDGRAVVLFDGPATAVRAARALAGRRRRRGHRRRGRARRDEVDGVRRAGRVDSSPTPRRPARCGSRPPSAPCWPGPAWMSSRPARPAGRRRAGRQAGLTSRARSATRTRPLPSDPGDIAAP